MPHTDIAILGGGFAGLNTAINLKKFPGKITLIDRANHHVFQPLLYQVATSELTPADISRSYREILQKQKNTSIRMETVVRVDKEAHLIYTAGQQAISYDYLVVALGARHSYFGHPEWEEHAPGLKTIEDALSLHDRILLSFEKAELCSTQEEAQSYLNFVIVGGGPTGVELAGALAEMTYSTLAKDFRHVSLKKAKIYLVQSNEHILPSFHPSLSEHSRKFLEKLGVKVLTKHHATHLEKGAVFIDDLKIPSMNVFWAAGNTASPILKTLDTPLDKQGRAIVNKDLTIPGHPEIFVIGDAAHVEGKKGPIPAIAPAAIQEGHYVAKILKKQLPPDKRPQFSYFDKGSMATIGKLYAICETGNIRVKGLLGWLIWAFIHLAYLVSFRNRFFVFVRWGIYLLSRARGVRLIAKPIDEIKPVTNEHSEHSTKRDT